MIYQGAIPARREFLYELQRNLKLLEQDLELRNAGFRYLFVIDFAAIYAYAYKTFAPGAIAPMPQESASRLFARQQMALSLIFNGFADPLLLIPPYAAELNNHLRVIKLQIELTELDLQISYRERLARLIEESEEFRHFLTIKKGHSEGNVGGDSLMEAALDLGKRYFPELYFVVTCASTNGLATFKRLLQESRLRDASDSFPSLTDFKYVSAPALVDKWYALIKASRSAERAYQTLIDAMACAYVEIANKDVNAKKQIVVFVSPSLHVSSALREKDLIVLPANMHLEVTRSLTYFLLAMVHKGENARVARTLEIVNELLDLYGASLLVGDTFTERSERLLEKAEADWRECENLVLMTEVPITAESLSNVAKNDRDSEFLQLLQKMHTAAGSSADDFGQEVVEVLANLRTQTSDLEKLMPMASTLETLGELKIKKAGNEVKILFPPFGSGLSMALYFAEPEMAQIAKRLVDATKQKMPAGLRMVQKAAMDLASSKEGRSEHHLLAAYIFALEGRYQSALTQLTIGLNSAQGITRSELLYLAAAIQRRLYHPVEAQRLITEALKYRPDEARYLIELGAIRWLNAHIFYTDSSQMFSDAIQTAIDSVNRAMELSIKNKPTPKFHIEAQNTLAFLYTDRALYHQGPHLDLRELEQAGIHIEQMEKLAESEWTSSFYDTRGWWRYAMALACTDIQEKKALLQGAANDLDTALNLERSIERRRQLLEDHKSKIGQALNELASAAFGSI